MAFDICALYFCRVHGAARPLAGSRGGALSRGAGTESLYGPAKKTFVKTHEPVLYCILYN